MPVFVVAADIPLRFSPGDGGSFLAELQQAIEDDKALQAALWPLSLNPQEVPFKYIYPQ